MARVSQEQEAAATQITGSFGALRDAAGTVTQATAGVERALAALGSQLDELEAYLGGMAADRA